MITSSRYVVTPALNVPNTSKSGREAVMLRGVISGLCGLRVDGMEFSLRILNMLDRMWLKGKCWRRARRGCRFSCLDTHFAGVSRRIVQQKVTGVVGSG